MITSDSQGQRKQQEILSNKGVHGYTGKKAVAMKFYIDRFWKAKQQRDNPRREFDNLDYESDYQWNVDEMNSYLTAKKNDDEVRVNTGVIEKKIDTVVNEVLDLNLQPEIQVFDKDDNEIREFGNDLEDLVNKTCIEERDEDLWAEAAWELYGQRAVFIEETYLDREVDNLLFGRQKIQQAKKVLLNGLQIYAGDITKSARLWDEQPFIVKYERHNWSEWFSLYGDLPNADKVNPRNPGTNQYGVSYDYRFNNSVGLDEVESLHYYSYIDDEYQMISNGIMMYKPGTSYRKIFGEYSGYHIRVGILKPTGRNFLYGRNLPASAKYLKAIGDESIRLLIRKFRQAIEPALGVANMTGKGGSRIYSKDVWQPSAVVYGVKKDDIFLLNPDQKGVTTDEVQIYKLIEDKTTEFLGVANILQGITDKKMSASQAMSQMQQAVKALGFAVYAMMRLKRDLTYSRIFTIFNNYTQPIARRKEGGSIVDVYRQFTMNDAQVDDATQGKKVIQFADRDLTPDEDQQVYAHNKKKKTEGKPEIYKVYNVKKMLQNPLKIYVTVNQAEREGSALNKVMFSDMLKQAEELSKVINQPLNAQTFTKKFESQWKIKDAFQEKIQQPGQGDGQGGQGGQQGTETGMPGQNTGKSSGQPNKGGFGGSVAQKGKPKNTAKPAQATLNNVYAQGPK